MKEDVWTGIIIATSVCVKNAAGINSATNEKHSFLPYGTLINIVSEEESSGGTWYKILFDDGQIGYVSSYYIEKVLMSAQTITNVNIHEWDGVGNEIVTTLPQGTIVAITSINKSGTWGFDMISRGWVSLEYIR